MSAVSMPSPPDLFASYFDAISEGDRRRAFQVIDDAWNAGLNLGVIYLDLFQPA